MKNQMFKLFAVCVGFVSVTSTLASERSVVCESSRYRLEFVAQYSPGSNGHGYNTRPKMTVRNVELIKLNRFYSDEVIYSSDREFSCPFRGRTVPGVGFQSFGCDPEERRSNEENALFKISYGMTDKYDPSIRGFAYAEVVYYGNRAFSPIAPLECRTRN